MNRSQIDQKLNAERNVRRVFFSGTTALKRGMGVCYNSDYGTATSADDNRMYEVEMPSQANSKRFAGVVKQDYGANAAGQAIDIDQPGGMADILVGIATVVDSTHLTCLVGRGIFSTGGFSGRGTARVMQTTPTASQTSAPGPIFSSLDGTARVAADGKTITKTGIGTNVVAGDIVYVLGGSTRADGSAAVTAGAYIVASVTNSAVIVLATACCAAISVVAVNIIRGYGTVRAYLQDGLESGLVEYVPVLVGDTPSITPTGWTWAIGGATDGSTTLTITSDSVPTLANGTSIGEKKAFGLTGTITTEDYIPTITSGVSLKPAGTSFDGWQTWAHTELDATGDVTIAEWTGSAWFAYFNVGPTLT